MDRTTIDALVKAQAGLNCAVSTFNGMGTVGARVNFVRDALKDVDKALSAAKAVIEAARALCVAQREKLYRLPVPQKYGACYGEINAVIHALSAYDKAPEDDAAACGEQRSGTAL